MTDKTKLILSELEDILKMLQNSGVSLSKPEIRTTANMLEKDLKENNIEPKPTFLQKMLKTAKDLFPLVVPIIKALII